MPEPAPRTSWIFEVVARIAFFFINVFALYLLIRGHSMPGGGFIAGLGTASSIVLLAIGVGLEDIRRIIRIDPVRIAAFGLFLATATSLAPTLLGAPFFTHYHWHLGDFIRGGPDFGTPFFFDLGVYLVVVGVSTKIVFVLFFSTYERHAFVRTEERLYSSPLEEPIEEDLPAVQPQERTDPASP